MERYINIIKDTSDAVIGKQIRSKRKPGFNVVCEDGLVRRYEARLIWLADTTNYNNERRYITRRRLIIFLDMRNENIYIRRRIGSQSS